MLILLIVDPYDFLYQMLQLKKQFNEPPLQ